jgi:radical SAM superfamily enzyme YgiQ (UPF0313 family)
LEEAAREIEEEAWREAGTLYVLMGVESTIDEVLRRVRKESTTREDFRACRLLKEHGIFSVVGQIVGFERETWSTFRTLLRQLRPYGGEYLNAMYATPHAWTSQNFIIWSEPLGDRVAAQGVDIAPFNRDKPVRA